MLRILAFLPLLLAACSSPMAERVTSAPPAALEAGVSFDLAQWRVAHISGVEYDLVLTVPGDMALPIAASENLRFTLDAVTDDVPLDFREASGKLHGLRINGADTPVRHEAEHLILPASLLRTGENRVEIAFDAGESSLNRNPDYLYTLFVPARARTVFPLFDQPDMKARYRLTLDLPEGWAALSNAPLESAATAGGRTVHRFAQGDPVSSYLFSFVAGKFDSVSRTVDGRQMTLLHRETDKAKVDRNLDEIFRLHGEALRWLEDYTGIAYPFAKFDFAIIPAFQYGGMEHPGAIQYNAESLFLDEDPSQPQLLGRANLIAHETAHMWFGDLVTMRWFDDVWTKEVFANFMAAKIVNPSFPGIDHELDFLLQSFPSAYAVDRTEGANPIRQHLANLDEAGSLYGAIIYSKAPIMMRQLEATMGETAFQHGIRDYLATFAGGNASWPELVAILDKRSPQDLGAWSQVWVETPGRPHFELSADGKDLLQRDPAGNGRAWPQVFGVKGDSETALNVSGATTRLPRVGELMFDSDGKGYGLFPIDPPLIASRWASMSGLERGAQLVNHYEQMLEGNPAAAPPAHYDFLLDQMPGETSELLLGEMLGQMSHIYWSLLPDDARGARAPAIEAVLWARANDVGLPASTRKLMLRSLQGFAQTDFALSRLELVWRGELALPGVSLSEREQIDLAASLALRLPERAQTILDVQAAHIANPDQQRRFAYLRPALSPDPAVRDAFFASLAKEENRATESWVLDALGYLHHPLRRAQSQAYVLPSLDLLEEIQRTGDIFFPGDWIARTLASHTDPAVAQTVRDFLATRPQYSPQLRMKILQAADPLFRAVRLRDGAGR